MHLFKPTVCAATLAASLLLPTFRAAAQDDTPPPAPKGTPSVAAPTASAAPANPGADFRQRMNERFKTALKASDDEWSVIEPLLSNVQDKTRDVMMSRFRGMMGRGGPGGPGGGRRGGDNNAAAAPAGAPANARPRREGPPPASAEATALESALQDDNTSVNDIKTRLAALRAERTKANADLESARADLKKVLNMRQEAVLVLAGMLE